MGAYLLYFELSNFIFWIKQDVLLTQNETYFETVYAY